MRILPTDPAAGLPAPRAELAEIFDAVYGAELVYVKDCWKLCGDAHCCSFQRYKSRYRIIGQSPFQELPLLPGEHAYLRDLGWLAQFEPYELRRQTFEVQGRTLHYDAIVSRRPGCACDHATRPTICRLYPLIPQFDIDGQLVGVEPATIYEEIERIGGLPSACRIDGLSFAQMQPFLAITSALARSPMLMFHLEAYRLTKRHVAVNLAARVQAGAKDVFQAFEGAYLRAALVDSAVLRRQLGGLIDAFDARWPGWDGIDGTPAREAGLQQLGGGAA